MRKDKPSMTARKVALSFVTLGVKAGMDKLISPVALEAAAEMLLASGVVGARTIRWARSQLAVSIYESFDQLLPGQFEAFGQRKAFCERQVREGIGAGATQVLVLGAGYDTLGWRLAPEFPEVNFFEIDHPATARLKARGVETMGRQDNLKLIAEDLGKRKLVDVLNNHGSWDRDARTVFIAEGLVMYLPPEAVSELFLQCADLSGKGSRFAFSYIPSGDDGRPGVGRWTGLMLWLQKLIGEPWIWSIRPEELGPFLEESGWPKILKADKYGVEFFVAAAR
jgi:methyltransferase (TIGR00027 family)